MTIIYYSSPSALQQEQLDWCVNNYWTKNSWRYDYKFGRFFFDNNEIAFMFALRWGNFNFL